MAKVHKSEAMAAVHEMMEGFHQSGAIDKQTMREFDEACLTAAEPLAPEEIRAIREREHLSQPVLLAISMSAKGWCRIGNGA